MSNNQKILVLLTIAAAGYMTYKKVTAQGSLMGSIDSDKLVESVLPWVNANPIVKHIASEVGKGMIRGLQRS